MLNHLTLEQKLSITKQFVGIIMEGATPTLPDLTINLKQCSIQPRSCRNPESIVWISWFLASRLDPTGVNRGGRLKHAPQIIFWKQKYKCTSPYSVLSEIGNEAPICLHVFCVRVNLVPIRRITACFNPELKFSCIFLQLRSHSQQSNHVWNASLHPWICCYY